MILYHYCQDKKEFKMIHYYFPTYRWQKSALLINKNILI